MIPTMQPLCTTGKEQKGPMPWAPATAGHLLDKLCPDVILKWIMLTVEEGKNATSLSLAICLREKILSDFKPSD